MIPKAISLKELKFENQYYVKGHYNFIFNVTYEDDSTKEINRRYSDIRSLYKTLLLKSPGCRIPSIPSKSIWLNINLANEAQKKKRAEGVNEFLDYLIHHKLLKKNKYVIKFFSKSENSFSYSNNMKSGKAGDNKNIDEFNEDDNEFDDFSSNIIDIKDDKKEREDKEININKDDEDDIEPLEDYIIEYENKNKGLVSKGKKIIGNVYNLVKTYTNDSNKKSEENEGDNNINENNDESTSSFFIKKLNKEDFDYVEKQYSKLGENPEINEYNNKINTLNDGVKMIINNFEKLSTIRKKTLFALQEIVNKDKDIIKLSNNNRKNSIDIDKKEDNEDKRIDNKHKNNIKKIRNYCTIQIGFLDQNFEENLSKIKKHQELLQDLSDIYSRKKEHINYLGRLHSQYQEFKKQNENNNMEKIKIKEFEDKLEHQIKFIKKINKDLEYEIQLYKKERNKEIYELINSIYKEKLKIMKDSIDYINKEKFDDDDFEKSEINNINNIDKDNKNKIEYSDKANEDEF